MQQEATIKMIANNKHGSKWKMKKAVKEYVIFITYSKYKSI